MLRPFAGAALMLALALPAAAQEGAGSIVAGPAGGTDFAIAEDIAAIGAECGLSLDVQATAGSVENMNAVRDRRATQLGIVQADVLEYFRTFAGDDPALERAAEGVRIAFPLYGEEVQVLARQDIGGLSELAGRRVATGAEGSGVRVTADLVLDLAQVEPAERLALAPAEALDALVAGEIDAIFEVAAAPAEIFRDARIDPARFHLLPLTDPVLRAVYAPAEVAAGTYPFVAEAVPVVAVRAVLVTYDWERQENAYQAASCGLVADVSHLIATRFEALKAGGHPKWNGVEVQDIPAGWEVSSCVLEGLAPGYPFTCRRSDGTVVEEGPDGVESDANALFLSRACARMGC